MKTNLEIIEKLIEKAVKKAKNTYVNSNMELNIVYNIKDEKFDLLWEQYNHETDNYLYIASIEGYYDDDDINYDDLCDKMLNQALYNLKYNYEIITKKQIIRMKNLIKKMDMSELKYEFGYIIFNKQLTNAYYSQYASSNSVSLSLSPNFRTTKTELYDKLDEIYNNAN